MTHLLLFSVAVQDYLTDDLSLIDSQVAKSRQHGFSERSVEAFSYKVVVHWSPRVLVFGNN